MWQRFTERAKKSVYHAQEEAGYLNDRLVTTGHMLLGLMRMEESGAARILDRLGIAPEAVTSGVRAVLQPGNAQPNTDFQLSRPAKVSIDRAYEEARALDNGYIGTEHLLLGIMAEEIGAGRVLIRLGATLDQARAVLREMQAGSVQPEP